MDPRELLMVAITACIWSFLYKETIFYRLGEKAFIGIAAAQTLCTGLQAVWAQNIVRVTGGDYLLIIPMLLGLSYLLRLSPTYRWISRYAIAILLGVGMGMAVRVAPWTFEQQVTSLFMNLTQPNNIIIIIGALTTVFYFIFMRKPGSVPDTISKIGRGFLMVNFGAIAAGVLLTRMTYLTERVHFILRALGIIPF